ncbi:MAG: DALR domain-containing protein, partial [Thermodesulfobacteriota bacterium]
DFALWKGSKPGEPTWESPWGPGRPGWHIECSAMSKKYLGDTFDIHGGGKDLVFPHHENEIAQSEGASGRPMVKVWIHHGFVTIKDEKMSKSLGNFLTIREVLEKYPAEVLRLFVFSTHYRNPLDYSETAMNDAVAGLERLYAALAGIDQLPKEGKTGAASAIGAKDREKLTTLETRFQQAMDNDFNTAQALAHFFEAVKTMNKVRQGLPTAPAAEDLSLLREGAATLRQIAAILGLLTEEPAAYMAARKSALLQGLAITEPEIESLIASRNQARREKDFARADAIRDELLARQIEIKDSPGGTTWSVRAS